MDGSNPPKAQKTEARTSLNTMPVVILEGFEEKKSNKLKEL